MSASVIAYLILGIFVILAILSVFFSKKEKGRKAFILAVYAIFFFYTIAQSLFYHDTQAGSSPDESAHISYVVYLHDSKLIIPDYEMMKLLNPDPLKWSVDLYEYRKPTCNYVCHPPLYYWILNQVDAVKDTEEYHVFQINKDALRYASLAIFAVGLILLLYIGYSRIDKDKPWLHLFYAAAATCIPMLSFEGCAVTNDNLALVCACVTIIGLLRFCESKRNFLTYFLIALGISSSLMTKMTTAILCVFMALIILFYTMIREKSVKNSLNKAFLCSIPVYAIALLYLGIIYSRYKTIQPSLEMVCSREYFESTIYYTDPAERMVMDFSQYMHFYFKQFWLSWTGIVGTFANFLKVSVFTKTGMVMELLWFTPILLIIPFFRKKNCPLVLPVLAAWASCLVTIVIQFKSAWGTFLSRGYLGGSQARYYLPFIFALSLAVVLVVEKLYDDVIIEKITNTKALSVIKYALVILTLTYAFLLVYSNFPYFLIHYGFVEVAAH